MKFDVTIIQTLEGHVTIEANSICEAIQIADKRYNAEGIGMPQMEDVSKLKFEAEPENAVCVYYKEFGDCACNNDHDELGECVYGNGVVDGAPICKYFKS